MTLADYVIPFVLLLGGLIFFHELGHFAVAKWLGVKVERFSIGFGPSILRKRVGETEYQIAWLPLGGYVRMLGELPGDELPESERDRAFTTQAVWKRIAIASAGPMMNFVLPVVLLAGIYMTGMPTPTSKLGTVVPESAAEKAGMLRGDRIVSVDGQPVDRWDAFAEAIEGREGSSVRFGIEREGTRLEVRVPELPAEGLGVEHDAPSATIAVVARAMPAGQAGLETGDLVRSLNGAEVASWQDLQQTLAGAQGPLELEVARKLGDDTETLRLRVPAPAPGEAWSLERLGVLQGDLAIASVDASSPAGRSGLEAGDLLIELDGEPITGFRALAEKVRASEGARLDVVVLRDGERIPLDVTPEERSLERHGVIERVFAIGIAGGAPRVRGEMVDEITRNPFRALALGTSRTWEITVRTFEGLGMLISGQVGRENLAGPIGIGVIAAQFYQLGWLQYIHIMAVISVNLAILNLLPVPILDGGQIVFALAEGVKGEPLSLRVREVAAQIGVSILVLLMGFAFWNDLSRYWSRILDFFEGLV
jgi:regulator of sigma E protease